MQIIKKEIEKYDISCLLEQTLPKNKYECQKKLKEYEGKINSKIIYATNKKKRNRGATIIIIKPHIEKFIIKTEILLEEKLINIHLKKDFHEYNIAVIYGPQKKKKKIYTEVVNLLKNKKNLIIMGDMNFTSNRTMQSTVRSQITITLGNKINKILEQLHLQDIHHLYKETKIKYSFKSYNLMSRIDRIYTNSETIRNITTYKIKPNFFSDHQAITAKLTWSKMQKWGKGTWKINNQILNEERYRTEINNAIEIYKLNKTLLQDPLKQWDDLKKNKKNITIRVSTMVR